MRKILKFDKEMKKKNKWYHNKKAKIVTAVASFFALISGTSCAALDDGTFNKLESENYPKSAVTLQTRPVKDIKKIEKKILANKLEKALLAIKKDSKKNIPEGQPYLTKDQAKGIADKVTKADPAFEKLAKVYITMKNCVELYHNKDETLYSKLNSLNDISKEIKEVSDIENKALFVDITYFAKGLEKLVLSKAGIQINEGQYAEAKLNVDLADILSSKYIMIGEDGKEILPAKYKIVKAVNKEIIEKNKAIARKYPDKSKEEISKLCKKELDKSLYGLGETVYGFIKDKKITEVSNDIKNNILEKAKSEYVTEVCKYADELAIEVKAAAKEGRSYDISSKETPIVKTINELYENAQFTSVNKVKDVFNLTSALVDDYINNADNVKKLKDMGVEASNFEGEAKKTFAFDLKLAVVSYLIKNKLPGGTSLSNFKTKEFAKPEGRDIGYKTLLGVGSVYQTPEEKEAGKVPSTGKKKGFGGN